MSVTLHPSDFHPPSYRYSPGSATPDTVRRGRRWRRPRSRRSAACCCTTCTPWPGWCSWRSWCVKSRASYRDEHSDSVDSLSSRTKRERQTITSELYWSENELWPSEFHISSTTSSSRCLSLSLCCVILSHRQVFRRWGRRWLPCRGWLSDRPPGLAPGRRRSPSRWALRATIAGWCWWRVTCPPSPSTTRWSSSGRPREITSAGVESGGEKRGRNVRCSTCWLMTAWQYTWFIVLSSCLKIHFMILFLVPTNHNISPESVSIKLLRSRGEISWSKILNIPFSSWEWNKYWRPFRGQVSLTEITNTTTRFQAKHCRDHYKLSNQKQSEENNQGGNAD